MKYIPQRGTSILLALAIVLVGISAAPVAAQDQTTDPGECDYASGDDDDSTTHDEKNEAGDPSGQPNCDGSGERVRPIGPPKERLGAEN